jgi:hypothetical protein
MPPPVAPGGPPGPQVATGNLSAALGLQPQGYQNSALKPRSPWEAALATLGGGMSAVGGLPRGANAGTAFAAGMGGALNAGVKDRNTLFNESSTAFRDMLAAEQQGNSDMLTKARAYWLTQRAQVAAAGGNSKTPWQNTPLGQIATGEQRVAAFIDPQRKSVDAQVRSGLLSDPVQIKKAYADLDAKADQFRRNFYAAAGIDPDKGMKMRDAGKTADNPIDTNGMSTPQFDAQVPLGGWYDSGKKYDKSGQYQIGNRTLTGKAGDPVVLQRTEPPAGWQPPEQQQQPQVAPGQMQAGVGPQAYDPATQDALYG